MMIFDATFIPSQESHIRNLNIISIQSIIDDDYNNNHHHHHNHHWYHITDYKRIKFYNNTF